MTEITLKLKHDWKLRIDLNGNPQFVASSLGTTVVLVNGRSLIDILNDIQSSDDWLSSIK